jgi:hypothetical protein
MTKVIYSHRNIETIGPVQPVPASVVINIHWLSMYQSMVDQTDPWLKKLTLP